MILTDPRTPKQEAGPPMSADGTALTSTLRVPVKPARMTREQTFTPHPRPETDDAREGRCPTNSTESFDTLYTECSARSESGPRLNTVSVPCDGAFRHRRGTESCALNARAAALSLCSTGSTLRLNSVGQS